MTHVIDVLLVSAKEPLQSGLCLHRLWCYILFRTACPRDQKTGAVLLTQRWQPHWLQHIDATKSYLQDGYDHVFPAQICMPPTLVLPFMAGLISQEVAMLCSQPQPLLQKLGFRTHSEMCKSWTDKPVMHMMSFVHAALWVHNNHNAQDRGNRCKMPMSVFW